MRKLILVPIFLLMLTSALAQTANNEALGGKTSDSKPAPITKPSTKAANTSTTTSAKRTSTAAPLSSPCGVYYKNRADMIAESNLPDRWFSLGQSIKTQFWYNPRRTVCDAKSAVLKSWIKEVHKDTDGDYSMVLYEMKCKSNQLRVKTVIDYHSNGNLLETTNRDDDEPFQDVAPGTAGVTMMKTACRRP